MPAWGMGTELMAIEPTMAQFERDGREGSARARSTVEAWRTQAGLTEAAKPGAADRVTVGWSEQTGSPDELVIRAGAKAVRVGGPEGERLGKLADRLPLMPKIASLTSADSCNAMRRQGSV
jgi:hypothetical protein